MTGKIVKGIAGFYYVVVGSAIYECKAKGIFRKEGIKPLVGDDVEIEITHEKDMEANIVHILPRRSELYRPSIANVDQALVVFALEDPKPSQGVLDRFLIQMERRNLPTIICFNKADLVSDEEVEKWKSIYTEAGYEVYAVSTNEFGKCQGDEANELLEKGHEESKKVRDSVEDVKRALLGKTTTVAGPSGVGKSTFINTVVPGANMETGHTSKKLGKGRNTTRHSELFEVCEDTFICDTPGFTSFLPEEMEKEELRGYFPEFREYEGQCRFLGCVHVNEPECALKDAVRAGKVKKARYRSYVQLFEELKEAEKHKY